jgi:hypothetical protein
MSRTLQKLTCCYNVATIGLGSDLVFDWDAENRDHIDRHKVSPEEAEQVVGNDPLDIDAETMEGEDRISGIGRTKQGRFLVVVTTLLKGRLRVVTAFPAPKSLIDLYFMHKGA